MDITMSTVLDQIENNGMEKAKIMNFVTMVKDGLSIGKAMQYSGLSEDKVEEIIKKYNL